MNIVIAVDSFKGSLSSMMAGEAIVSGIKKVIPYVDTTIIPMADGGEGTVEALITAVKGKKYQTIVTSPLGEPIEADVGILPDGTAVLEMAAASGLPLVPKEKRNPLVTTSYGTGELIKKALDMGAQEILIGIGGSATNDGGAGMAQALGLKFLDENGVEIPWGGGGLERLSTIDVSGLDPRLQHVVITVMCDVDNPLCGPQGASAVYGPQKGATPDMVKRLDHNLAHLANVIENQLGIDVKNVPGAGAAGGLGAGLLAFTPATLKTGIEAVLDTVGFDEIIKDADLIITGEGRIDGQSIFGKVPMGVAKRAVKAGKPVVAIVGSIGEGAESLYDHGLNSIMSITNSPMSLEEAMEKAYELTSSAAERMIRILQINVQNLLKNSI